ncbi:MAG: hypothetical protein ACRETD_12785, partial [Steroidobacteraceae bacterium]
MFRVALKGAAAAYALPVVRWFLKRRSQQVRARFGGPLESNHRQAPPEAVEKLLTHLDLDAPRFFRTLLAELGDRGRNLDARLDR